MSDSVETGRFGLLILYGLQQENNFLSELSSWTLPTAKNTNIWVEDEDVYEVE